MAAISIPGLTSLKTTSTITIIIANVPRLSGPNRREMITLLPVPIRKAASCTKNVIPIVGAIIFFTS